jgi:hypothetical protein
MNLTNVRKEKYLMKKALVVSAIVAMAATSVFALNKGETELENDGWFRYTNVCPGLDLSKSTRSDFSLDRGYIRLSHQWTTQLFSKMTVDVLSSKDYTDGASIRLKEAYVDFTLPVKFMDLKVTPGLQKNYFSYIYSWDYTHMEKSLADKEGIVASADYGVTLNGFLPKGLGEIQIGAYNGAGYKKIFSSNYGPTNTNFDWVGNLHLTPIGGVMVGSSIMYQASDR